MSQILKTNFIFHFRKLFCGVLIVLCLVMYTFWTSTGETDRAEIIKLQHIDLDKRESKLPPGSNIEDRRAESKQSEIIKHQPVDFARGESKLAFASNIEDRRALDDINLKKSASASASDVKRSRIRNKPNSDSESLLVCKENFVDTRTFTTVRNAHGQDTNDDGRDGTNSIMPIIYFVTPTYPRREQIPELIRLGQTLMHVPNLHWIVANDADSCNRQLDEFLNRFGIPYTHISSPMAGIHSRKFLVPRGVANRQAGINWIRKNGKKPGVLYFGDDDNTYDLRLFDEIRYTKKVSMFPVGLVGTFSISSPIVRNGKVIAFFDPCTEHRLWAVDMAGFAVSLDYLEKSPDATMPYKGGFEEDEFLKNIGLKIDDIEPKAKNCTEVLVWHTHTTNREPAIIHIDDRNLKLDDINLGELLKSMNALGVSHTSTSSGAQAKIGKDGETIDISNDVI